MRAGSGSRSWMPTSPWSRTANRPPWSGWTAVYRPPPGAWLCPVIAYLVTAATTRSFLSRIVAAITDPAAAQRGEAGRAAVRPGTLAVASLMTLPSGKAENLEALTAG